MEIPVKHNRTKTNNLIVTAVVFTLIAVSGYFIFEISGVLTSGLIRKTGRKLLAILVYLSPLPIILFLTQIWPARKENTVISSGFFLDLVYFLINFVMQFSILALVGFGLKTFYDLYLGFLTVEIAGQFPLWAKIILAFLFADFMGWFHHLIRHKITVFWYFHEVHHSQNRLNYFTDARVHLFDYIIASIIVFIPQFMIQIPVPSVIILAVITKWHRMTYHANIRTNYGLLRYVLVTPQSHRIHHSKDPDHYDKNFGVNLSIWDHLFGTQYRNYKEYPEAGVPDKDFPLEANLNFIGLLATFGAQFIYPFKLVLRKMRALKKV